jgi:dinuclear metal center YbgI/SA1388 family protein
MARTADLIAALDELLRPDAFEDFGPNGLQVPGRAETTRVVSGVTASKALIDRAVEARAELVLVHHGLFWSFHPTGLSPMLAGRLRPLFQHDIGLAGYHLPLDAHPTLGNNAILADLIGCTSHEPFAGVGRGGVLPGDGIGLDELVARTRSATGGRAPLVQGAGPERIRRVAFLSGSGAKFVTNAIAEGYDAYVTGEPAEHVMAEATEGGIHFLAAGHYATETHGIRALGDLLARRFGVEHVFVDLPNPV